LSVIKVSANECLTFVRLGQILNKSRSQNKPATAKKGRIAYLPLDVEANVKFIRDNLIDINSLCVFNTGQPTKAQKDGTSVADLTKVYATLLWLHQNKLLVQRYTDIHGRTLLLCIFMLRDTNWRMVHLLHITGCAVAAALL